MQYGIGEENMVLLKVALTSLNLNSGTWPIHIVMGSLTRTSTVLVESSSGCNASGLSPLAGEPLPAMLPPEYMPPSTKDSHPSVSSMKQQLVEDLSPRGQKLHEG